MELDIPSMCREEKARLTKLYPKKTEEEIDEMVDDIINDLME